VQENESLIGAVGTHLHGFDELEIGYWFASAVRGRGMGAEAVRAVVQVVGAAFPDRRIVAECRPQNTASWRLLEKIGFRADGAAGVRTGRKRLVFVQKT
jgi:RimJ/RimL family protein N-acetyltransferase